MAVALANARVLSSQGWRNDAAVVIEDGTILELTARIPSNVEVHDLSGRMLLPGFIDCQVNGGGGVLFNDQPTAEGIRAIGAAHRRFGTTGFLRGGEAVAAPEHEQVLHVAQTIDQW